MRPSFLIVILAGFLLTACATSSHEGRVQIVVPQEVSTVYSEVDMRLKLATAADAREDAPAGLPCLREPCDTPQEFEWKVLETGERLSESAYKRFPDLVKRIPQFDFAVAKKDDAGTLSNAAGAIVVLDGVRRLGLNDEALKFLIAREMGHVIGRHHDEDSATNIIMSVAVGLLLPMTNLFRGALIALPGSAGLSATTTTASATTAATTAVSLAGSTLVRASYRAEQVREADGIALQLMAGSGSELHDVADALAAVAAIPEDDRWSRDLRGSAQRLEQLACGPGRIHRESDGEAELALSMNLAPLDPSPDRQ